MHPRRSRNSQNWLNNIPARSSPAIGWPDRWPAAVKFNQRLNNWKSASIKVGVTGPAWRDTELTNLRNEPRFDQLLQNMRDLPPGVLPSRSFSATDYWAKNGWPNSTPDQGQQYMLSTILAMTGDRMSTLDQALDQLTRSAEADGSNPEGTFYFAKHNDIRSKIRHGQMDFAAAELKSLGFNAVVSDQTCPQNEKQIIGAVLGSSVVKWSDSNSKFLPGALVDNLTSYGGWWAKPEQTKLTDYLNAGAAGASGAVYEPYTVTPKFPDSRLLVHYARGCTLAESFYQSLRSPFQLLVVGDPLCRPFGQFPKFEIEGLQNRTVVKDDFELKLVSQPGGPEIDHFEIFFDGVYFARAKESQKIQFATGAMGDGYHEVRVVAVGQSPIAIRQSERLEFFLRRDGQSVKVSVTESQVRLGQPVEITAVSDPASRIEIRQNSRVLGTVQTNEKLQIDSALLGRGTVTLQGFAVLDGKTVASELVEIEIKP